MAVALYALDGEQPWLGDRCSCLGPAGRRAALQPACRSPEAAPSGPGAQLTLGRRPAGMGQAVVDPLLDDVAEERMGAEGAVTR